MNESNEFKIIRTAQNWLDSIVIGLNLCPFAKAPRMKDSIHFRVSKSPNEEGVLFDLKTELERLSGDDTIETTLVILPEALSDFGTYNQFLDLADDLLIAMELDGIFQIASFHPAYQFSDTTAEAAENFTNRSPYPILHILRESSLDVAIDSHPDTQSIPAQNSKLMNEMGSEQLKKLLKTCFVK